MQFGLGQERCVLGLLVLHWLDMGTQGFVGLTYWKLLNSCMGSIRITDTDGIAKLAALKYRGTAAGKQPVHQMVLTLSQGKCPAASP